MQQPKYSYLQRGEKL